MIERSELNAEMEALTRQRADTVETLSRIDGALQMVRHLIDKDSAKVIAERAAKDAADDAARARTDVGENGAA